MESSQAELENLRQSLAEVQEKLRLAEETLEAIYSGEVNALITESKIKETANCRISRLNA